MVLTEITEDFEHNQEEDIYVELTKERNVAKSSPSDGSFKENPYTYLSENNPALLSCLCDIIPFLL